MKIKINTVAKSIDAMNLKVVEVTKTHYKLENGDVYEHTFDINDKITVEEFQKCLDNAKNVMLETLNKIEKEKI